MDLQRTALHVQCFDRDGRGYLREVDAEDWIGDLIPSFRSLRNGNVPADFHSFYIHCIVRRLLFWHNLDFGGMGANVSRAVLLAGSHLPYASFNRSCVYVHEVRKTLQARGLSVSLRCGRDTDDDVVLASRAAWVAVTGGGFSELLLRVATSFGARELKARSAAHGPPHQGAG